MMECKELTARKHMVSKGIGRIEHEPCGKPSKAEIEYTRNGKECKKHLCGIHLRSVTAALNKNNISWEYLTTPQGSKQK